MGKPIEILDGRFVYLRRLLRSDLDCFCAWYSNAQVTRFLAMKPLSRAEAKRMFEHLLDDSNGVYFGVIKKGEERPIGYVFLAHISKSHKVARELGIVIGEESLWGHGYGSEAAKLMLEYGFKQLGLHRIELLVFDFNQRARNMYSKLGFVEEGVLREARLVDRQWHDVIMMGMLESEFGK